MTCVVFGATGLIGRHLMPRLLNHGLDVLAVSRRPAPADSSATWRQGRLPDRVPAMPSDLSALICVGPLAHFSRWLASASVPGAPRVIAMSSMSALSKRDSPVAAERGLAARLHKYEDRLRTRCDALGSACTILRATLIHGGPEGALEQMAARARRCHVFPLPRGRGLRQPVHAADLADAALAALDRPRATGVFQIGGGETLTAREMFARVRAAWAPRTLGVPVPGWTCRWLAQVDGRRRGMWRRLDQDLVSDNTNVARWLDVQPRGFTPAAQAGALYTPND